MLGFAMPDPSAIITATLTSIAGALASMAKDHSDRKALKADVAKVKVQVAEVVEAVERLKSRVRHTARGSMPDGIATDLQRQLDDAHEKLDGITRRLDEHDGQWTTLQRELGGIGAKIEILLAGMR